jgi:hypothetical protein
MRLMYGPPAVRFDPDKPIRQIAVELPVTDSIPPAEKVAE